MIIRNSIAALALWSLLLAPILCGVGVLSHSCICTVSDECHHEVQCPTDPCQIQALGSTLQNNRAGHSTIPEDQSPPPTLVDSFVIRPQMRREPLCDPDGHLPKTLEPDRCLPLLC